MTARGRSLVLRGDAARLPLPDGSVDLIVTSPPYWSQRSYQDGGEHYDGQIGAEPTPSAYVDALIACTREWMRVLKPSGSLWVNLGDKYAQATERSRNGAGQRQADDPRSGGLAASVYLGEPVYLGAKNNGGVPQKSLIGLPWRYAIRCVDDLGLILRAEVIWSKTTCMPESVTDRVGRRHEVLFHLVKESRYYAELDDVREPPVRRDSPRQMGTRNKTPRHEQATDRTGWKNNLVAHHPAGRIPGSVWELPTEPLRVPEELGVDHFAAFPTALPRRIISGWCPPGGLVVDPFGGTGTTAAVAAALGRTGISVDMSSDYSRVAQWRTTDPAQRAKALGVAAPPVQLEGQAELVAADAFAVSAR